jgi:nicotinate dehydrogenase subunit B
MAPWWASPTYWNSCPPTAGLRPAGALHLPDDAARIADQSTTNGAEVPYNMRPLMAGWNALYLSSSPAPTDPTRNAQWNRGAELVGGLGHCSACHSDRNILGAEVKGALHLGGGFADGWHAPAIGSLSQSPVRWTEDALYDYLRKGRSADHGSAAGPMGHVVESLAPLPDSDIRAMATYLASLDAKPTKQPQKGVQTVTAASAAAEVQARSTIRSARACLRVHARPVTTTPRRSRHSRSTPTCTRKARIILLGRSSMACPIRWASARK